MAAVFTVSGIVFLQSGGAMPEQPVLAVFPPWWGALDSVRAVAAAEGRLMRPGAWPGLMMVQSDDPALAARLREAGAWLVLGSHIALVCGAATGRVP